MDDKNNFSQGSSMLISGVLVGDLVILNALLFAMWHYFGNVAYGLPLKTFVTSSIVYLMCTGRNGVVLYKRKVSNHNIVMRVLQNVTTFGVVTTCCYGLEASPCCLCWAWVSIWLHLS